MSIVSVAAGPVRVRKEVSVGVRVSVEDSAPTLAPAGTAMVSKELPPLPVAKDNPPLPFVLINCPLVPSVVGQLYVALPPRRKRLFEALKRISSMASVTFVQ